MSEVSLKELLSKSKGPNDPQFLKGYLEIYHEQHMASEEKHKEETQKYQKEIEALQQENAKLRADLVEKEKAIKDVREITAQAISLFEKMNSDEKYPIPDEKYPILNKGLNYIDPDIKKMKKDSDSKMIDQSVRQKKDSDSNNSKSKSDPDDSRVFISSHDHPWNY